MKLIVGLGNPGNRYNFTRHNVGFLTLDYFLKVGDFSWASKPKYNAIYCRIAAEQARKFFPKTDTDVLFIKPQGFYNETGRVVADFMRFYKIPTTDLIVICDDFNLDFGKIRLRSSGSAGGNNGLKSIIAALKTEDFGRLRVGTGNDELRSKMGDADFVLSRFTPEEKSTLPNILNETIEKLSDFIN